MDSLVLSLKRQQRTVYDVLPDTTSQASAMNSLVLSLLKDDNVQCMMCYQTRRHISNT